MMESSYCSQYESVFNESVCDDWCLGVLGAIDDAYKETNKFCRYPRFGEQPAHDTRSTILRGLIETRLKDISSDLGMISESRHNKRRSASHTWVKAGNLYLTASSVHTPQGKPRQADFRDIYQSNGQGELLETEKNLQSDDLVYAVLLYGSPQLSSPSFVRIAFPSRHWTKYVESIDLMARYPDAISKVARTEEMQEPSIEKLPEEMIPQPPKPVIRRLPKRVGEGQE